MLHREVFDKLAKSVPEAVMVRAALENALPPSFVDDIFERVSSVSRQVKTSHSSAGCFQPGDEVE